MSEFILHDLSLENLNIAIVGLGYVGLPLAVEFGKHYPVTGYDISHERISELQSGKDSTLEIEPDTLKSANHLSFTSKKEEISECNIYIVTVPTPIDEHKQPNLSPLIEASKTIGSMITIGDVVIYESTVYPGATVEVCVPVLEAVSGLRFNQDFFIGYSPERINPGDKKHGLTEVVKVTSGSCPEISIFIDNLYASIIPAGTHPAPSIEVAEAAKIIENTQRDLNIALVNELAIIFNRMNIDTKAVLDAARTKWNFLPFHPGLVGGHCIGVDPYYLTHKAEAIGYHPQIILAGRRLNDGMSSFVASQLVKQMLKTRIHVSGAKILVLGFTFKENCPDIRNTRIVDVIDELNDYGASVDVFDPWVNQREMKAKYFINQINALKQNTYNAIILAVPHEQFIGMGARRIKALGKKNCVFYDLHSVFDESESDLRL